MFFFCGSDLEVAAHFLHVDEYQLMDALTQKTRLLRGEVISTPLDIDQVTSHHGNEHNICSSDDCSDDQHLC